MQDFLYYMQDDGLIPSKFKIFTVGTKFQYNNYQISITLIVNQ